MQALPVDILLSIFSYCEPSELASTSVACRSFHALIEEYCWPDYLRRTPRPTWSISFDSAKSQVRHNHGTDRAWTLKSFTARPLSRPWQTKAQPSMAMNSVFLVIGAGSSIFIYTLGPASQVHFYKEVHMPGPAVGKRRSDDSPKIRTDDVTSLAFLSGNVVLVGRQYGSVQSFDLDRTDAQPSLQQEGIIELHTGALIESMASEDRCSLALSSNGRATLLSASSSSGDTINLNKRSWTSYLPTSPTFAAFGTASTTPLVIHNISPHSLDDVPSAILRRRGDGSHSMSAVYAITHGPPASPWGTSPQILASGWFDGIVRIYDLRAASNLPPLQKDGQSIPQHTPILTMQDPWSWDPVYSLSLGGGGGTHVAAGMARHSVVALWDIRNVMSSSPERGRKTGWSVHAPGNDQSPVYGLVAEGSRIWGVTERRPFILDFANYAGSWPDVERVRGDGLLNLKKSANNARNGRKEKDFYVTVYSHDTGANVQEKW